LRQGTWEFSFGRFSLLFFFFSEEKKNEKKQKKKKSQNRNMDKVI